MKTIKAIPVDDVIYLLKKIDVELGKIIYNRNIDENTRLLRLETLLGSIIDVRLAIEKGEDIADNFV